MSQHDGAHLREMVHEDTSWYVLYLLITLSQLTLPKRKMLLCTLICLYCGRARGYWMCSDGQIHFCSMREEKRLKISHSCLSDRVTTQAENSSGKYWCWRKSVSCHKCGRLYVHGDECVLGKTSPVLLDFWLRIWISSWSHPVCFPY